MFLLLTLCAPYTLTRVCRIVFFAALSRFGALSLYWTDSPRKLPGCVFSGNFPFQPATAPSSESSVKIILYSIINCKRFFVERMKLYKILRTSAFSAENRTILPLLYPNVNSGIKNRYVSDRIFNIIAICQISLHTAKTLTPRR